MALTRGAPAALIAAMSTRGWHPVVMLYMDWPSGAVRVHSGVGTITWGGHDWTGLADYGRVEVPAESQSGAARRTVLTLYGGAADLLSSAAEKVRGRSGEIYAGAVTARAGNVLVTDPVRIWRGTGDALSFRLRTIDEEGPDVEAALQLTLVSGPALRRSASQYHTQEDQAAQGYATDTIGRLIQAADQQAQALTWPQ